MTTHQLEPASELVDKALGSAGPGGCIVMVNDSSEADIRFAVNTMTTNGVRRHRSVTVVRFASKPTGTATGIASASGSVDIDELLAAADADAQASEPAEDASPLVQGDVASDFSEPPVATHPSLLEGALSQLGGAFERARSAGNVIAGFAEHSTTTSYLGSSTGLRLRHVQPTGKIEVVARDRAGTRSAWVGQGTVDFGDVDTAEIERRLLERLAWADRRVDLDAGRYEVIMPPDAVADLVFLIGDAASGRAAEDGRSVFSAPGGHTRIGETLARTPFDLRSDPAEPGLACSPFVLASGSGPDVSVFDNGLAIEPTHWIRGGKLERLQYHRAGAARSNREPTPPVDNLVLEVPGSDATIESMIASTERALLLTCLWYIREVDMSTLLVTGLTRDGVFLVENGEIVGAVNNFRFNESPVDVLARSTEVGRTQRALSREWNEYFNRVAMPTLRVEGFNMSSVSPAT